MSTDPIVPDLVHPQSFNLYSFVRNNPINKVDPSGKSECNAPDYSNGNCSVGPSDDNTSSASNIEWKLLNTSIAQPYAASRIPVTIVAPFHINMPEDLNSVFPHEAAANALYFEHRQLHPVNFLNNQEEYNWITERWVGDSIGIVQTMINRVRFGGWPSIVQIATSGHYAWGASRVCGENGDEICWPRTERNQFLYTQTYWQFAAIAYATLNFDIPDWINGSQGFAHQDTGFVNGYDPNLINAGGKNDRAAFGPPVGRKTIYVPPLPFELRKLYLLCLLES